jgi:hypothetical protein
MANEKGAGGTNVGLYVGVAVIALVTIGIVVFVGFGGSDSGSDDVAAVDDTSEDTSDATGDPADDTTATTSGAAIPEGSGECSAVEYPGGELQAQDGLNDAVAETRTQIALAAASCDYAALQGVMGSGFVWGFGPGETGTTGAINDWTTRESAGEPVLLDLLEIIALDFAVADDGTYTFPAASQWKAPAWASASEEDLAALVSIYGQENVDRWRAGARFDGYRVGIRENGGWYYFAGNEL